MSNRFLDNLIALRMLKTLTQKWTETPAFKAGVIDSQGKFIVKPYQQTIAQKNSYSKLDVLVFNLRKLIEKVPLGKRTIAKYIIALRLIQEEVGEDLNMVIPYLEEHCEDINCLNELFEDAGMGASSSNVTGGIDMADRRLGDKEKNSSIVDHKPDDEFNGHPVFDVKSEHLMKSRFGKRAPLRYSTYVGKDEVGEKIRSYSRSNPKKAIILRNNSSMMYLRKPPNV
jgi:hypothetical protein